MMLARKLSIIFIGCGLLLLTSRFAYLFAQGKEYLRTRSGSLAAEDTTVSAKKVPLVEYFLAPDDEIEIFVWKNSDLTRTVTVGPDGKISYSLTGRMQVVGLTIAQLEDKIQEKLIEQTKFISVGDELEIFVWQNADLSKTVVVGADGQLPYPLVGRIEAAGLTVSQFEEKLKEKLSEYIKHPQVSVSVKKVAGLVSVSVKRFAGNKIIILGEVGYPGIYTYKGTIDLIEAIALAGDFNDQAHRDSVILVRGNFTNNPQVRRINMAKIISRGTKDTSIVLQPNDLVFVPKTFVANFNKFLSDIGPIMGTASSMLSLREEIRRVKRSSPGE